MASVNIRYVCDCGYTTDRLVEAVRHSNEKKHSLTVLGTITTAKEKKELRRIH